MVETWLERADTVSTLIRFLGSIVHLNRHKSHVLPGREWQFRKAGVRLVPARLAGFQLDKLDLSDLRIIYFMSLKPTIMATKGKSENDTKIAAYLGKILPFP